MTRTIECLRCHATMEPGFVIDGIQGGGIAQQRWSPGEPKRSFWTGIKAEPDQLIKVTTLRCPNCGYLESYADKATSRD
jgi:hypothetical protein